MLRLWIDADRTSELFPELLRQLDHLVEGGHLEEPVVGVRAKRQPFLRAQRLDLGEGQVFREPAGDRLSIDRLGLFPVWKPFARVCRATHLVLVARDEHAVFRRDEVRLDEIRTHLGGEAVAFERVLGPMPARAAVADDQRASCCRCIEHQQQDNAGGLYHRNLNPSCSWRAS